MPSSIRLLVHGRARSGPDLSLEPTHIDSTRFKKLRKPRIYSTTSNFDLILTALSSKFLTRHDLNHQTNEVYDSTQPYFMVGWNIIFKTFQFFKNSWKSFLLMMELFCLRLNHNGPIKKWLDIAKFSWEMSLQSVKKGSFTLVCLWCC